MTYGWLRWSSSDHRLKVEPLSRLETNCDDDDDDDGDEKERMPLNLYEAPSKYIIIV